MTTIIGDQIKAFQKKYGDTSPTGRNPLEGLMGRFSKEQDKHFPKNDPYASFKRILAQAVSDEAIQKEVFFEHTRDEAVGESIIEIGRRLAEAIKVYDTKGSILDEEERTKA